MIKWVARTLAKVLVKIAEDEKLRAALSRRGEELGAALIRGAKKEMDKRFDWIRVPQLEEEKET